MPNYKPDLITLRRHDLNEPWGFRMAGGANGQSFYVQKVIPDSIAHRFGLQEGAILVRIGNITLKGLSQEEVQNIVLRCRNTIDLFVSSHGEESVPVSGIQSPNPMGVSRGQYSPHHQSGVNAGPHSLTEQVLNRMAEKHVYYDFTEYSNPSSPPTQHQTFVKERDMYEYNAYSPSKSPQSPNQKLTTIQTSSGRYSPAFSPTNMQMSYHKPEEQQWLSSRDNQSKDNRVFGVNPRARSQSPSPSPSKSGVQPQNEIQRERVVVKGGNRDVKDNRVFGVTRQRSRTDSPTFNEPKPEYSTQDNTQQQTTVVTIKSVSKPKQNMSNEERIQREGQFNQQNANQRPVSPANTFNVRLNSKPDQNRAVPDRRVFGSRKLHKLGGSLDEQPHWKEALPHLKPLPIETNLLLPSHAKKAQTYIVQTPPTERWMRPPSSGSRRIRPVWPPPGHNQTINLKPAFTRDTESPNRWPTSREASVDRENYETVTYTIPPGQTPGDRYWRASSVESGSGRRSVTPTGRARSKNWPPPSNATPAGMSGYMPDGYGLRGESLPDSRRDSEGLDTSDIYVYTINQKSPQTYSHSPNSQYYEQPYYYDTE